MGLANDFVVTFNASATQARVQTLVQAVTYANTNANNPAPGMRTIRFA